MRMNGRNIPFTKARQHFTAIIDEVEKSGKPITIVRHGKPAAVIIDHETYEEFLGRNVQKKWTLKGSIIVRPGVDLDASLKRAKEDRIRLWKRRRGKLNKELREA